MTMAGIILFIMAGVCLGIALFLYRISRGEETEDMTVWGTVLVQSAENTVVSFMMEGKEIQAYADSIPARERPEVGEAVRLAVRKDPIPGDEDRWHAAVLTEEEGPAFAQKIFYGLMAVSVILAVTGLLLVSGVFTRFV